MLSSLFFHIGEDTIPVGLKDNPAFSTVSVAGKQRVSHAFVILPVRPFVKSGLVTVHAATGPVDRDSRIEEQLAAQSDALGSDREFCG